MNIKKFENFNIIKKNKNIKLSKEEKKKIKLENKIKKKELKELKKENKKIFNTNKQVLPFLDVDEDESFITKDGFLDIYQIESHDIYSFSDNETQIYIYNFIRFLRSYSEDFKIIAMNFPVNTVKQQE
ncbi:hypothetical protein GBZ86_16190, partial [Clostridium tarantellae]|nr:hypothetical protein [Clostridium tarantellae]